MVRTIHDYHDDSVRLTIVTCSFVSDPFSIEVPIINPDPDPMSATGHAMTPDGYVRGEALLEAKLIELGVLVADEAMDGCFTCAPGQSTWDVNELARRARGFFGGYRQRVFAAENEGKMAVMWVVPPYHPKMAELGERYQNPLDRAPS
jgi:hypothetical protein